MTMSRRAVVCVGAFLMGVGCGGGRGGDGHTMPVEEPGTTLVSVSTAGVQANRVSTDVAISGNAGIIAFLSEATNLTPDAANCVGEPCLFIRDRAAGTTSRVAVDGEAPFGPALSLDGRFVAFTARVGGQIAAAVLILDRIRGHIDRIDVRPDGTPSHLARGNFLTSPAISPDGRFVVFGSDAPDLVDGDTNGVADVFVRDRTRHVTERVSVSSDGTEANASGFFIGPAISADGRFVAFSTAASNLVPDDHNSTERCNDIDGCADVFVRDRAAGTTERVNVASDGSEANGTSAINTALGISADGRFVTFSSNATNLVPGDDDRGVDWFDAYRHDRETGVTERMSVAPDGTRGNGPSYSDGISADGRSVVFTSTATNLLGTPEMGCSIGACSWVFVRVPDDGATAVADVTPDGSSSTRSNVFGGALSADGAVV
ncbi:MAG TPA: hypothetical protein VGK30_02500, partial [Candidatus Binatia bacterium]